MGTGKSRQQKSDSDSHIKSTEIAGHITVTKNHTSLTITIKMLNLQAKFSFSV